MEPGRFSRLESPFHHLTVMEAHVSSIKQLYEQADESDRTGIKNDVRMLLDALDGPRNVVVSRYNTVRTSKPTQLTK
jgi:hypothetical protein